MISTIEIPVDNETEEIIDNYFSTKEKKKINMLKESDVIVVIQECVNRPKGVVPDIVYELIPNIRF
jgi:hypothetical protein